MVIKILTIFQETIGRLNCQNCWISPSKDSCFIYSFNLIEILFVRHNMIKSSFGTKRSL